MKAAADAARMTISTGRGALRRVLTALILTAACVVGPATAARADVTWLTDGFDNNPAARWTIWSTSSGVGGFGDSYAYLDHTQAAGWTEIGRDVLLTPIDNTHSCVPHIRLAANSNGTVSVVNIEVIDPATSRYLSLGQVRVSGGEFQNYIAPTWHNGPRTVRFRISLLAAPPREYRHLKIDSMWLNCSY